MENGILTDAAGIQASRACSGPHNCKPAAMLWFQFQLQAGTPLNLPGHKPGTTPAAGDPPPPKAGPLQVAATMFCGIFAIGAKGTWHKSGATVTFRQVVIGAAITLIVLIVVLAALVKLAVR